MIDDRSAKARTAEMKVTKQPVVVVIVVIVAETTDDIHDLFLFDVEIDRVWIMYESVYLFVCMMFAGLRTHDVEKCILYHLLRDFSYTARTTKRK